MSLIIDCHGHYTVLPKGHDAWREEQKAAFAEGRPAPPYPDITDDEIRQTIEDNQLRLIKERGADLTIFSPRASAMAHHVGDQDVSATWARHCNNLIHRVTQLFPDVFVGGCMLPQSPQAGLEASVSELRRCVEELGFVSCNLNPDPGGGHFQHPPLTDDYWFPLYEVMEELQVPGMIHVSGSCNPAMHATGGYYLAADTVAFMQLLQGDLFSRFPGLRFIIPHGGGAVPYHWGRYRGLADMLKQPSAVRGIDPQTGHYFDDTKRYVDALDISEDERRAIFEGNARRVFPRLDALLKERGL